MKKGGLIILEGPDGSGKTTLLHSIANCFEEAGVTYQKCSFPGNEAGSLGEWVYRLHHDSSSVGIQSVTPAALQALHIAAHLDSIERQIIPLINSGCTVLMDRFWWSTWVYGRYFDVPEEILINLIEAERVVWANLLPTSLFLIKRDTSFKKDDINWTRISNLYDQLLTGEVNCYPVHCIENNFSVDVAVERIWSIISSTNSAQ